MLLNGCRIGRISLIVISSFTDEKWVRKEWGEFSKDAELVKSGAEIQPAVLLANF